MGIILLGVTCSTVLHAQVGCPASATDSDGNVYPVVQIGGQCWMAKNLTTSHYTNGDSIPTGLSNTDWEVTTAGASTVYAFDPVNDTTFGKLYSWYAATDPRGLCPQGWHMPSDQDWKDLELTLGMDPLEVDNINVRGTLANVGGQMKSTDLWAPPNTGATNSSGFSALPGGYAGYDQTFEMLHVYGDFWSTDEYNGSGIGRTLYDYEAGIARGYYIKQVGYSCRCVYDQLVGIEEEGGAPALAVLPNPTTGALQVLVPEAGGSYSVIDAQGQVLVNGRLVAGLNTLDLSVLRSGLYVVQVDGTTRRSVRVVKE